MPPRRDTPPLNVPLAQRNLYWASVIANLILDNAELQRQMPEGAHLVVLPIDDPELCVHNLRLRGGAKPGTQVVFVEVKLEEDAMVRVQPLQSLAPRRVPAPKPAFA